MTTDSQSKQRESSETAVAIFVSLVALFASFLVIAGFVFGWSHGPDVYSAVKSSVCAITAILYARTGKGLFWVALWTMTTIASIFTMAAPS